MGNINLIFFFIILIILIIVIYYKYYKKKYYNNEIEIKNEIAKYNANGSTNWKIK